MSLTISWKSPVASGWKTMVVNPGVEIAWLALRANVGVDSANSRSGAGPLTLRRPSSASRKPMRRSLRGALQLRLQALEGREPLLERRVRREQVEHRLLGARGEAVERVELGVRR